MSDHIAVELPKLTAAGDALQETYTKLTQHLADMDAQAALLKAVWIASGSDAAAKYELHRAALVADIESIGNYAKKFSATTHEVVALHMANEGKRANSFA